MNLSVVIPLFNEEESLVELCDWIEKVMRENNFSYEVLLVDDGSKDKSWQVIESISQKNSRVKGIKFKRNYGKSAALQVGFEAAQGEVIITMDADLQDSPDEIPGLHDLVKKGGFDLVSGWKKKRYDPLTKTIPTKLFNAVTRWMSGIELHDFNCGLKAYSSDAVKNIEVYGEMHRFIPVIAKWAGYTKITEKEVQHRERKFGKTKFGMERFVNGFLDLITIFFVSRFGKRPMHFFGSLGTVLFLFGGLISAALITEKLVHLYKHIPARQVTDQPLFYLALVAMIIGSQLFLAGFIGELIGRNSPIRNSYLIEKKI
jgi:glycosyltransferase involved in cell wall biosynthesis